MREFTIKGFPNPFHADGALDLMRKMKSMSPMDYDARDGVFLTRLCQRLKIEVPNPSMTSDTRSRLVLIEMLKNGTAKEVKDAV